MRWRFITLLWVTLEQRWGPYKETPAHGRTESLASRLTPLPRGEGSGKIPVQRNDGTLRNVTLDSLHSVFITLVNMLHNVAIHSLDVVSMTAGNIFIMLTINQTVCVILTACPCLFSALSRQLRSALQGVPRPLQRLLPHHGELCLPVGRWQGLLWRGQGQGWLWDEGDLSWPHCIMALILCTYVKCTKKNPASNVFLNSRPVWLLLFFRLFVFFSLPFHFYASVVETSSLVFSMC